jgi:hypothetical protein
MSLTLGRFVEFPRAAPSGIPQTSLGFRGHLITNFPHIMVLLINKQMRKSFNSSIPFSPTRFSDVLPAPIENWISPKVLPRKLKLLQYHFIDYNWTLTGKFWINWRFSYKAARERVTKVAVLNKKLGNFRFATATKSSTTTRFFPSNISN